MKINKQAGFTIIELMVAVVIASILAATAIPSFTNMIQDGRITSTYNGLVSELAYARSEAVKRSTRIGICTRATDTQCASNAANWNNGWLVFVDSTRNSSLDTGETILRVTQALPSGQDLNAYDFSDTSVITYLPRGNSNSPGYFTVCDDRGEVDAKAVNVLITGAVRQAVDASDNKIVENMSGEDITCPAN